MPTLGTYGIGLPLFHHEIDFIDLFYFRKSRKKPTGNSRSDRKNGTTCDRKSSSKMEVVRKEEEKWEEKWEENWIKKEEENTLIFRKNSKWTKISFENSDLTIFKF